MTDLAGLAAESGKPAALAHSGQPLAAAGENLVRVRLVANVPDQTVAWSIERVVQRDGEFDHAQARPEMTAGHRNRRNRLLPQLVGQLTQLVGPQATDVGRHIDSVEKWRRTGVGHALHTIYVVRVA